MEMKRHMLICLSYSYWWLRKNREVVILKRSEIVIKKVNRKGCIY